MFLIYLNHWLNVFASDTHALLLLQENDTPLFPKCFILIQDVNISPGYISKRESFPTVDKEINCETHFFINILWQSLSWDMVTDVSSHLQN